MSSALAYKSSPSLSGSQMEREWGTVIHVPEDFWEGESHTQIIIHIRYDGDDPIRLKRNWVTAYATHSWRDSLWTVSDSLTGEYGVGSTRDEAVDNYMSNLHDMALWFKNNERELGPLMKQRLQGFRRLFGEL